MSRAFAVMKSCSALVLTIFAVVSLGCGGSSNTSSDGALPEQADDGASTSSSQSAMVALTVSGASGSAASDVAQSAATSTVSSLTPSGCATQTQTGPLVVYTFNGCTGPYGLVAVNGSLSVTYGIAAGGAVTAAFASTNLKIGATTIDLNGNATEQTSGSSGSLILVASSSATGPHGHQVTLSGSSNVSWNTSTQCVSLTGSWSTQVDTLTWTTAAANYEQCAGACPNAGGSLSYMGPVSSVVLTFDGSANASYMLGDGKSGTIALSCG